LDVREDLGILAVTQPRPGILALVAVLSVDVRTTGCDRWVHGGIRNPRDHARAPTPGYVGGRPRGDAARREVPMRPWQALVLTLALSCAGWSAAARASDVAEPATTLAAPADEAPPATRSYRVDPKQSALWVTVYADRSALASRFAHDHAIAATDYTGRVTWPTSDPSLCSVSFDVPVRSLWPDPPGFRERAGIDPDDSVGDPAKRTIVDNMLGKHQLDAAHHPTITFRSQRCDGVAGQVRVTGDLTIRGVTRSVTVPLQI